MSVYISEQIGCFSAAEVAFDLLTQVVQINHDFFDMGVLKPIKGPIQERATADLNHWLWC